MGISARNVFRGRVVACTPGAVHAEVEVELPGGDRMVAIVTREAVAELGLAPGVEVSAVIKASDVLLGVPQRR